MLCNIPVNEDSRGLGLCRRDLIFTVQRSVLTLIEHSFFAIGAILILTGKTSLESLSMDPLL